MDSLADLEDRLAAQAIQLSMDVRDDLGAAHRTAAALERLELEQVCIVLAAMVDTSKPMSVIAWWRQMPPFAGDEAA